MAHAAVIGAGIAGLLPAYYLAKRGFRVTVYEQESYPAMRTSYANGGQISASNSEVWTRWSTIWKGIKWMGKKDAPLLIRPSLDPDKALWLAKFLWHTAKGDWAKRTARTIKLAVEARVLYDDIIKSEALEFDQTPCGILHVYRNAGYFAAAREIQDLYQSNGCGWEIVYRTGVLDIEPTLENSPGIIGGAWTPDDWTGDIHKFCWELARVLKEKYGVIFLYNRKITELVDGIYDITVVANGVGSVALAKAAGDRLPIYPVKGYSITLEGADLATLPKCSLLDDQCKIVTSTLGGRFRIAGTAEFAGENYDISRSRIDPLLNWVKDNLPDVNRRTYSQWACLRPMTPDMMPIVAPSRKAGVYYHVGHGHLGWTLSPATAKLLVDSIKD